MTAVCITGMHRSGTSMVAKLLSLCGLYLGSEEELMPSDNFNADGYWENLEFVEINNILLSYFKGAWDLPPASNLYFDMTLVPESLTRKAQELIHRFEEKKNWGWKDPRSSITLRFWQQLIPNLKVIICLRNPLEVAQSLSNRDDFSRLFSFNLWHTYNEALLNNTSPENRLITPYNAYFTHPQNELQRLLEFIGVSPNEDELKIACDATVSSLRHNYTTFGNLIAAGPPLKTVNLYMEMSKQAQTPHWNIFTAPEKNNAQPPSNNNNDFERDLLLNLTQKDLVTQTLVTYLSEKEQELEAIIRKKEQELEVIVRKNEQITTELRNIHNSRAWHYLLILRQIRQVLFH